MIPAPPLACAPTHRIAVEPVDADHIRAEAARIAQTANRAECQQSLTSSPRVVAIPRPGAAMRPDHGVPLTRHRLNDQNGGELAYEHRLARKIIL